MNYHSIRRDEYTNGIFKNSFGKLHIIVQLVGLYVLKYMMLTINNDSTKCQKTTNKKSVSQIGSLF